MFTPDMQVTIRRRVLRHAGCAQDHLIHRRVAALRQSGDLILVDCVGRCAQIRHDLISRLVQFANDGDIAQLGDIR